MQQTTNYNLNKIELTDSPPDITVINPNWDTIDTAIKAVDNSLVEHKAENMAVLLEITSGFATGITGNIKCWKTKKNLVFLSVDLNRNVDYAPNEAVTAFTMPEGYKPLSSINTLVNSSTSTGGPIENAFFTITLSNTGSLTIRANNNGKTGVRYVYGATLSFVTEEAI